MLAFVLTSLACSSETGSARGVPAREAAHPSLVGGDAGVPPADEPAAVEVCEPHEPVLDSETRNARDLGGTPLADGATLVCGAVYRGPPLSLTPTGCDDAAQLGLRTLLDLRVDAERDAAPDSACVDAERVFAPLPIPYGLAAADYLNVLHETASLALAFRTFGDPQAYPIYFHCTYGRDRTGVVAALLLLAVGASRSTVMEEYLLSQPSVGAYPDSLDAVLDEVEQRGGAAAVLREAGIGDAELAAMRRKLVVAH